MAKLSIFGLEFKYSKKRTFAFSRFFFSLYILYFGYSLWKDSSNVNGDMKQFQQGCYKIFGDDNKTCSEGLYSLVSKLLALNFIISAFLCVPYKKKIHRHGGTLGFVGMLVYMIMVNPLLVQYHNSNNKLAVLLDSDSMENFLMNIAICGGFMLIMANGYNEDDEFTGRLIQSSDEGGDNPTRNGRGPSSRHVMN